MNFKLKNISFLLGLMMCLGSCSDEDMPGEENVLNGTLTINVGVQDEESDSRVDIELNYRRLLWTKGDVLLLVGYDDNYQFLGMNELKMVKGEGGMEAVFTGEPVSGATHYQLHYKTPKLQMDEMTGQVYGMDFTGQLQNGEYGVDHLREYMKIASDTVLAADLTKSKVVMKADNSIIHMSVSSYPADLENLSMLMWRVDNPAPLDGYPRIMNLNMKNMEKGSSFVGTISFDASEMVMLQHSRLSLQLVGSNKIYQAQAIAMKGKIYKRGGVSNAYVDKSFVWKEVKTPANEVWLHTNGAIPDVTEGFVCSATMNDAGYFVMKKQDNSDFTTLPANCFGFDASAEVDRVILPEGLTEIEDNALSELYKLESVLFPTTLKRIGDGVFASKNKLREVSLPEGLTHLGNYVFANCKNLEKVVLPSTLIAMGDAVFRNNPVLQAVTLPEQLTQIGQSVFEGCIALSAINWPAALKMIPNNTFAGCEKIRRFTIPEGVTEVGDMAFAGCEGLKDVKVPQSMEMIGNSAMANCKWLQTVKLPATLKRLGVAAFAKSGMVSIELPQGLNSLPPYLFSGCSNLGTAVLPEQTDTVPYGFFEGCSSLDLFGELTNVKVIGKNAFAGCKAIEAVNLHEGLLEIGPGAFSGTSLGTVDLPNSVTTVYGSSFVNCPKLFKFFGKFASADGKSLVDGGKLIAVVAKNLTALTVPEGVKVIQTGMLSGCQTLESLVLPNSLVTIESGAFARCTALASVKLGTGLKDIQASAFEGCGVLTKVQLPQELNSLGDMAFGGCAGLQEVQMPNGLTSMGKAVFYGCSKLAKFTGKSATADGKMIVMDGVLKAVAPSGLTQLNIPQGVTTVGDMVAARCEQLESVSFPSSLTTIAPYAFAMSGLQIVDIPKGVNKIGKDAFMNLRNLKEVYIKPSSFIELAPRAFSGAAILYLNVVLKDQVSYGAWNDAYWKDILYIDEHGNQVLP